MKRVALIGCGAVSQVHIKAIAGMEDAELAAVCDIIEEKALLRRDEYIREIKGNGMPSDGIRICTDWHELCDIDIDVVHICTPHYLHVPMAVELLDAGKAVFMEKPCAISVEQFEELASTDQRHPGKLGVCFQNRYNETTRIIDRAVAEGKIGKVTGGRAFVTWRRDEEYYTCSPWKGRLATEGGGTLINQSIHTLDLLLRYLGEPVDVKATLANHHLNHEEDHNFNRIEVEDTVEAWMEFKNGARACFYASTGYAADAPVILEIQGEKGRISMNGSTVFLENEEDGFLILASDIPVKGSGETLLAGNSLQAVTDMPGNELQTEAGRQFGNEEQSVISNGIICLRQNQGKDWQQTGQRPCKIKNYWGFGHKACIKDFYRCLTTGDPFPVNLKSTENSFRTMMKIYGYRR